MTDMMSMDDNHGEPMVVRDFRGAVMISGPGQIQGAMTPDAAEASGYLLIEAAIRAREWLATPRPQLGTAP